MQVRLPRWAPVPALLVIAAAAPAEVRWTTASHREGGAVIWTATARNEGTAPAVPGRFKIHKADLKLGPETVALVMSGWQGPSGVRKVRGAKPLSSQTLVQLFDGTQAWQAGFVTMDRVVSGHDVRWDDARQSIVVESWCDFGKWQLAPGATVTAETLRIESGGDPYAALEHWADAVASHYRPPVWPKIPAGWVGWSWVDSFNVERYEDVVRRNVRAIREKLNGFDIEYVWVSIGNLAGRRPGAWLDWNRELFPSGPETLVRDLGKLDFRLGLWAGAYWLNSELPYYEQMRDAVLLRDGKPITVPKSQ